jgi:hypothetical protein
MNRHQKIIIGVVTLLFVIGIGSAFRFLTHQGVTTESRGEIQLPVSQDETVTMRVPEKQEIALPLQEVTPVATVTSKADAEKMLQDTESDFQSIDVDVSAQ